MDRPVTTLFMLMSVDGKISIGASDRFDIEGDELSGLGVLELEDCAVLEGSYLRLRYRVTS